MIRKRTIETIKQDLYNFWIIIKRMPILLLFASSIIGGMALIVWILGNAVRLIMGA